MGEYYQKIAAPDVVEEAVASTAECLLAWLVNRQIVLGERKDCTLGSADGFPPGDRAESALAPAAYQGWRKRRPIGVELITKRTVFFRLDHAQSSVCPSCRQQNGPDFFEKTVFPKIDEWFSKNGNMEILCIHCDRRTELRHWRFDPTWAFADFGLIFWNWPMLSDRFFGELSVVTGSRIVYVADKL